MSGISRALPGHPSVRFLKIEAKRRLAAGEFASLHAAQQAIAAEFRQPNWAVLKTAIGESAAGPAMDQLAWVIERFADATGPGWIRPSGSPSWPRYPGPGKRSTRVRTGKHPGASPESHPRRCGPWPTRSSPPPAHRR
jgi:hypothetical protein